MKKNKIKSKITERLISSSKLNHDNFDINFWQRAGAGYRFMAMWLMVKEFCKLRGKNADKLRLRRSIQNIKQI